MPRAKGQLHHFERGEQLRMNGAAASAQRPRRRLMRNYDRINAPAPDRITEKRAHIIGGGIAGLASAAFLVSDAHMPGANVTVYESLGLMGGSMDAAGDAEHGFTSRGERELR